MDWLETNAPEDSVVLSSQIIGEYIPALTGTYAFLAHWAQTLNFFDKTRMVDEFFSPETSDAARRQILDSYSVDYIYYGPAEQALGAYDPDEATWLSPVFVSDKVTIFAVNYR